MHMTMQSFTSGCQPQFCEEKTFVVLLHKPHPGKACDEECLPREVIDVCKRLGRSLEAFSDFAATLDGTVLYVLRVDQDDMEGRLQALIEREPPKGERALVAIHGHTSGDKVDFSEVVDLSQAVLDVCHPQHEGFYE
jgi:hypothetical protein